MARPREKARVKIKPPICPNCGRKAKLDDGQYGYKWRCPTIACDSYVGCHPGSKRPLGVLANADLRQAKMAAHEAFDRLWKGKMRRDNCGKQAARSTGYRWLAEQLNLSANDCHIGMFDLATCQRTVEVCTPPFNKGATNGASPSR